ncbi:MAG: fibronectin type III domain-containing protein [Candidatus Methanofastidiosia archaeon]
MWKRIGMLIFFVLMLTAVPETAANPALVVRISEKAIAVAAGSSTTIQATYENVGDSALHIYLVIYDDGSNPQSPRPILVYKGQPFTTAINTGIIFGELDLPVGEFITVDLTFQVSDTVTQGNYTMRIAGYQEKVGDTYIGYGEEGLVLTVGPPVLSTPALGSPRNDAQITGAPVLQWSLVSGAKGYGYELSMSPDVDENGRFLAGICSGSTTSLSIGITCNLQKNAWIYWHVWAYADEKTGSVSALFRFMITDQNTAPVILSAAVSPQTGDSDTVFTFTAKYQDQDNNPGMVHVYIDGVEFDMVPRDPTDTVYTDGCVYQHETTLSEGTHTFYVICEDGRGGSKRYPESGTITGPIVSGGVALSQPMLVNPQNEASIDSAPVLTWSVVSGAEGYAWEISLSSDVDQNSRFLSIVCSGSTTLPSTSVACDLQKNIWLYWHVWAYAGEEIGPISSVFRFKIVELLPSPVLSSPPINAVDVELRPTFSWSAVEKASSYTIQVATDLSFQTVIIDETVSATSYVPSFDLQEKTMYYWRVRTRSDEQTSEWASGYFTTGLLSGLLQAPILSYPSNNGKNVELRPIFSWSMAEGAGAYVIQVSTSSSFAHFAINEKVTASSYMTSFDLEPETLYFWRVRAENEDGPGTWSQYWSFETTHVEKDVLEPPIVATPDGEEGEGGIRLSWNAVGDADLYEIQVSKTKTFPRNSLEKISSVTTLEVTTTSAEVKLATGTYYWRVRGKNEKGTSDWSKGDHWFIIAELNTLKKVVFDPLVQGMVVISAALSIIYVVVSFFRKKRSD